MALIGASLGVGCCTYALFTEFRDDAPTWRTLLRLAGAGLVLFLVLAYVRVGFGALFGVEPAQLLSFDSDVHHPKPGVLIAMWAALGASIELALVAGLVAWYQR